MQSPITGGCYCGKVRFRVSGPNLRQSNCHCANCRRAAGAQSVAWITVKRYAEEKISWVRLVDGSFHHP
jgi:hypothetical protein